MASEPAIVTAQRISSLILVVRGQRVMLDSTLARVYGVTTKQLNQAFQRNRKRFPEDFVFQVTEAELENLRSHSVISSLHGGRRYLPWAFSEHGAVMLSMVIRNATAVQASVWIVRAFFSMREQLAANKQFARKLAELEGRVDTHDDALTELFEAIRQLLEPAVPTNGPAKSEIGFHIKEDAVPYRIGVRRRK